MHILVRETQTNIISVKRKKNATKVLNMDPVSSYDMEDVRGTDRDSLGEIDLS